MKINSASVLTKEDLAMAVTISAGEVSRYVSMLEHDEYMFKLMDDSVATAPTVQIALAGVLGDVPGLKHLARGYDFSKMQFKFYPAWSYFPDHSDDLNLSASVRSCERDGGVSTGAEDAQARSDETGTLYERPEM